MQFLVVLMVAIPFLLVARISSTIFGTEEPPATMAFRDTVPALLFSCIFIAPYFGGASDLPYYFSAATITFVLAWLYYRGQTETRPAMSSREVHQVVFEAMVWSSTIAFFAAAGGGIYSAYHWLRFGKPADATILSLVGRVETGWVGLDKILAGLLEMQWPIGALIIAVCIIFLGLWFDDHAPKTKPPE